MSEHLKRTFTFSFCSDKIELSLDPNMLMSDVYKEIVKEIPRFKGFSFKYVSYAELIKAENTKVSDVSKNVLTVVSVPIKIAFNNKEKEIEMKPWNTTDDLPNFIENNNEKDTNDVFDISVDGKSVQKVPISQFVGKTILIKKDKQQLIETRKQGFPDDESVKALNLVSWDLTNALFILKNGLLKETELLSELINLVKPFSKLISEIESLKKPTALESLKCLKEIQISNQKSQEEAAFANCEKEYIRTHSFTVFNTDEMKERALKKGYKPQPEMIKQWKDCVLSNPDLAYTTAVAATIFTNSHQFLSSKTYFAERLGLPTTENYEFLSSTAKAEDIMKEIEIVNHDVSQENIQAITEMGIDSNTAMRALVLTNSDIEHAINIIFSGDLEERERSRGLDPTKYVIKSWELMKNYQDNSITTILVDSLNDHSLFYSFMKAAGLKNPVHYLNSAVFAKNIGFFNEIDEFSIVKNAFADGFIKKEDLIKANSAFGKKMSDIEEDAKQKLINDHKGYEPDFLAFLFELFDKDYQKLNDFLINK